MQAGAVEFWSSNVARDRSTNVGVANTVPIPR